MITSISPVIIENGSKEESVNLPSGKPRVLARSGTTAGKHELNGVSYGIIDSSFWLLIFAYHSLLVLHSLLNKISEYEEAFDKPKPGRPAKGSKKGSLSRGEQKKINEFMSDLKGVVSIV